MKQSAEKHSGVIIIAEVKPWSPFGKPLSTKSWDQLFELANACGDVISIHTHPLWRGSFDLIRKARKRTQKKILAKGFHETDDEIKQAIDAGADHVLVVGRIPKVHLNICFIEPLTLAELAGIPKDTWAVWNSRDLSGLKNLPGIPPFLIERWKQGVGLSDQKQESFKEAREVHSGLLCQASNLRTKNDIDPGADAVLVGSKLETFAASLGITL